MGVFLHKHIQMFDDGIPCKYKNYTKVWMLPSIILIYTPKLYLGEQIHCLFPPIAELLRSEPGVIFQETAVLGGSCIKIICLKKVIG